MTKHHVKIVLTEPTRGEVFIDGEKVNGVTGFVVSGGINKVPEVALTMLARAVEVEVPDATVVRETTDLSNDGSRTYEITKCKSN